MCNNLVETLRKFVCSCIFIVSCRSAERQAEKPQGLSVNTEQAEVTVIPDRPRDSQTSDSDSDGPILYRDEEEDEEEDEYTTSMSSSENFREALPDYSCDVVICRLFNEAPP